MLSDSQWARIAQARPLKTVRDQICRKKSESDENLMKVCTHKSSRMLCGRQEPGTLNESLYVSRYAFHTTTFFFSILAVAGI